MRCKSSAFSFGAPRSPTLTHGRCLDALDVDDSNDIAFNDGIQLLFYLFADGPAPAEPFPICNVDPTLDGLGCVTYEPCPGRSRIVFVVDRSSATCGIEIEISKRYLLLQIAQMSASVEFAIVFYDRGIRSFPAAPPLARASRSGNQTAQKFVASTQCGSGTCIRRAFQLAFTFLADGSGVICLLSHSGTTCPGADPIQYAKVTLDEIRARLNGTQIRIEAKIVGNDRTDFVAGLEELENVTLTRWPR
jgi:hypothetical protein